jgi:hypothetical protein
MRFVMQSAVDTRQGPKGNDPCRPTSPRPGCCSPR